MALLVINGGGRRWNRKSLIVSNGTIEMEARVALGARIERCDSGSAKTTANNLFIVRVVSLGCARSIGFTLSMGALLLMFD